MWLVARKVRRFSQGFHFITPPPVTKGTFGGLHSCENAFQAMIRDNFINIGVNQITSPESLNI